MVSHLSVYIPTGTFDRERNPFGVTVANRELHRALAVHGGFDTLTFITQEGASPEQLAAHLGLAEGLPAGVRASQRGSPNAAAAARRGGIFRGGPDFSDLAWERRRDAGDSAYSLVGLIHTLAPPEVRRRAAQAAVAPTRPWDAQICTSPSVKQAMQAMYETWDAYLAERFSGAPGPRPLLPVIPLGVDQARLAALADRPGARAAVRARLGLAADAILVLWVGRLSFFEKAYPQPMFRALEEAVGATGAKVHFAMAGWFPNGDVDRDRYREAANTYAPSVGVSFEDGNDPACVADLWAGADIFLSLVDNIQETFGLTPVEAMAAGLPVVVSDWDGYRFTVRDGREGFLIPTLGGPADGTGAELARFHLLQVEAYQSYVGSVAQHTAVDVGAAARALAQLIRSPELRRRMGAAGRARVVAAFDWPVVVGELRALLDELAAIRSRAAPESAARTPDPVAVDPFRDFAGFPSSRLEPSTHLRVRPGVTVADLARADTIQLDRMASFRRAPSARAVQAFNLIEAGEAVTLAAILAHFPAELHGPVQLSLLWMCKLGLLEWRA